MELITLVLSGLTFIGFVVASLYFRSYLPSYVAEKGKNLASKEDLAHLTNLVESIRNHHNSELERLKADLFTESQITERRRRVYEEMCVALRVFISGHRGTPEMMERFHNSYAAGWLWASDDVLVALNHFIALQVQHTTNQTSVSQEIMKGAYTSIIIEMRKDVGFSDTIVSSSDYQFVKF